MKNIEKKIKVRFEPLGIVIYVNFGSTILDAAQKAGIYIYASCGGLGRCGKCLVEILQGKIQGGLSAYIDLSSINQGLRQACLATLTEDVVVKVEIENTLNKVNMNFLAEDLVKIPEFLDDKTKKIINFEPALAKVMVKVQAPTCEDNKNDLLRLIKALHELGEKNLSFDFKIIRDLPNIWRYGNWQLTASIMRPLSRGRGHNQVIRIEAGDTKVQNLAIALDLGTTTIWAQLVDLNNGQILATESSLNLQIVYGDDVISRIIYAEKPGGLKQLQEAVIKSINELLESIVCSNAIRLDNVSLVIIAGNTTMTQIFLGIEPKYIRLEPYVPATTYYPIMKAFKFGLKVADYVRLLIFPSVSSFVGGDIVSGIIGTRIHKQIDLTLFIDLGTNGEVVIGNQDWLACTAASAGPAFEGSSIKFGMHATMGAIKNCSVSISGEPSLITTIGQVKPKGICGSGLISIVAALLKVGLIDERGSLNLDHSSPRLRNGEDGPEYVLVWAADTQIGRDIVITEIDIYNFIRAKGAINAAYMTLLEELGLNFYDINRVILAGGFGQSINLEQAIMVGLLPELPIERFTFMGNTSLLGARLISVYNSLRSEVVDIIDKIINFELITVPNYISNYTSSLFLPHTNGKIFFPQTYDKLQLKRAILFKKN